MSPGLHPEIERMWDADERASAAERWRRPRLRWLNQYTTDRTRYQLEVRALQGRLLDAERRAEEAEARLKRSPYEQIEEAKSRLKALEGALRELAALCYGEHLTGRSNVFDAAVLAARQALFPGQQK